MRSAILSLVLPLLAFPLLQAEQLKCPDADSQMVMEKGEYSARPGVTFQLQGFSAKMVPRSRRMPLCLSKMANVERGDVFVSSDSLTRLFNQKIQGTESKVKDVKIEMEDKLVHIHGTVKKVLPISFEISGPVSTDGTALRVEAKSIKADGLPVKGLLDMVGAELGSLLGSKSVAGVVVKGNFIFFQPEQLAHVKGHLATAEATPKGLFVKFATLKAKKR